MDASLALAHNVANIRFEDIPFDTVRVAKMSVLDTLGNALAASTLGPAGCRQVVELVKEGGGKEESTIVGFGGRAPSWMAALVNSTMAHSLDYDDMYAPASIHAGVTIVPPAFAAAERVGEVDGRRFIAAVVSGFDLSCRLSLATPNTRTWHTTTVCGFFGAAAAASRILGLKQARVQHALGIAYSQAAGNLQAAADASFTMRLEVGFAAKGGVLSALLAEKGITGATNSLEGEFGLYRVYHGGRYDPAVLTSGLGKRFEGSNLTFKPYPCGRGTHSSIDATLELVREHNIQPEEVESITVFKGRVAAKVEGTPLERKRRPETVVDAQSSIPYTVAAAAVKRRVGLTEFTPRAITDPDVLEVAQKVDVQVHPEFGEFDFHPGITEIRTKGGKVYSRRIDRPSGDPQNPIPWESLVRKFMESASHCVKPLPERKVRDVADMVMKLEEVDDVGAIVRLLA
ncbi:MAG: MmgE/PrpD family protein [Chloroflexi bacterium]|nr:MmgE/PrpD family protein [Chloroflexota bacterium]